MDSKANRGVWTIWRACGAMKTAWQDIWLVHTAAYQGFKRCVGWRVQTTRCCSCAKGLQKSSSRGSCAIAICHAGAEKYWRLRTCTDLAAHMLLRSRYSVK